MSELNSLVFLIYGWKTYRDNNFLSRFRLYRSVLDLCFISLSAFLSALLWLSKVLHAWAPFSAAIGVDAYAALVSGYQAQRKWSMLVRKATKKKLVFSISISISYFFIR